MKLQVRKLQESDWKFLPEWWKSNKQDDSIENLRDFLPGSFQIGNYEKKRAGLGGFIVCKEDDPIAVVWLIMTNSNRAIATKVISDLSYGDEDKEKALQLLNNFVNNFAKELGYKYITELVENTKLVKKL
tara:strand:+ start:75 stop:464 length:390 start_codon:yes stop_codon:yes gene_type:complete